jgi:hypothetical protein
VPEFFLTQVFMPEFFLSQVVMPEFSSLGFHYRCDC